MKPSCRPIRSYWWSPNPPGSRKRRKQCRSLASIIINWMIAGLRVTSARCYSINGGWACVSYHQHSAECDFMWWTIRSEFQDSWNRFLFRILGISFFSRFLESVSFQDSWNRFLSRILGIGFFPGFLESVSFQDLSSGSLFLEYSQASFQNPF